MLTRPDPQRYVSIFPELLHNFAKELHDSQIFECNAFHN